MWSDYFLTHGPAGSQKYIWTFKTEQGTDPGYKCHLFRHSKYLATSAALATFLENYSCDTGNSGPQFNLTACYLMTDPLCGMVNVAALPASSIMVPSTSATAHCYNLVDIFMFYLYLSSVWHCTQT